MSERGKRGKGQRGEGRYEMNWGFASKFHIVKLEISRENILFSRKCLSQFACFLFVFAGDLRKPVEHAGIKYLWGNLSEKNRIFTVTISYCVLPLANH